MEYEWTIMLKVHCSFLFQILSFRVKSEVAAIDNNEPGTSKPPKPTNHTTTEPCFSMSDLNSSNASKVPTTPFKKVTAADLFEQQILYQPG